MTERQNDAHQEIVCLPISLCDEQAIEARIDDGLLCLLLLLCTFFLGAFLDLFFERSQLSRCQQLANDKTRPPTLSRIVLDTWIL